MYAMELLKTALKNCFMRLSLNKKLVAMMLFLNFSLIVILIFLYLQTEQTLFREFENKTAELTQAIQIGIEEVTAKGLTDEKRLQKYLQKLNQKGVNEISIISNSDKIISSTNPRNIGKWITKTKKELIFKADLGEPITGKGHAYDVVIPVIADDKHFGYIHLAVNTEDFSTEMKHRVVKRILAALLIFGIGILLSVFLARSYTKPIEAVVEAAKHVAAGDLDQTLVSSRTDEIGELSSSFNYMVGKLKKERELEEKLRKAEHLAGIGQFATSIAHEIKNPLNFISLSIDLIREKYKPAEGATHQNFDSLILNIKKEILRVSRFAESFLEYGRPLELNRQMTDINRLINEVLDLVTAKAQKDNIQIRKSCEPLPELFVDPEFIKTCMYNIILNAFQAMPAEGMLTVETRQQNRSVLFMVGDTGIGIPEERIAKVFDPFFTTKTSGLGLGLALTKRIIEEHGGKIELTSREGWGTIVSIILPMEGEA